MIQGESLGKSVLCLQVLIVVDERVLWRLSKIQGNDVSLSVVLVCRQALIAVDERGWPGFEGLIFAAAEAFVSFGGDEGDYFSRFGH